MSLDWASHSLTALISFICAGGGAHATSSAIAMIYSNGTPDSVSSTCLWRVELVSKIGSASRQALMLEAV
jgi:hypothetical protein